MLRGNVYFFSIVAACYLLIPKNESELKTYCGYPYNFIEKVAGGRYGGAGSIHFEFQIGNEKFYFSGQKLKEIKNILTDKRNIQVKATKNHGINLNINVVYSLKVDDKEIVSFSDSVSDNYSVIYISMTVSIISLMGVFWGIYSYRNLSGAK